MSKFDVIPCYDDDISRWRVLFTALYSISYGLAFQFDGC